MPDQPSSLRPPPRSPSNLGTVREPGMRMTMEMLQVEESPEPRPAAEREAPGA